jgi:aspartyl protease family protein
MRGILCFFIFVAVVGVGLSREIGKAFTKPGEPGGVNAMAMATKPAAAPSAPGNYRTVTLNGDGHGHFQTDVRIDGRTIAVMVDTGASLVALNEKSAAKLGIHPSARDYNVRTQTANGVGKAARVRLDRIELNGITVRNVEAFVMPDEALSTNLLGMSFLSRVKWTHDRGRLVLEQ